MLPITTLFLILVSVFVSCSNVIAARVETMGDRAPHGLAYQNPTVSLSPSAYDFFHPSNNAAADADPLCGSSASSECSGFPLTSTAAQVQATQVHQPTLPGSQAKTASSSVGPRGIAGIVVGLAFALLLAMGAYYVVITRRSNSDKATSSPQPDV